MGITSTACMNVEGEGVNHVGDVQETKGRSDVIE